MYFGYDQNGNIIRYGHGEERLMGKPKAVPAKKVIPVKKIIADRNTQLIKPEEPKKTNKQLYQNMMFIIVGIVGWWFVTKKESTPDYDPYEDNSEYRDYIKGARKQLPGLLSEAQKPYRGKMELSEFQKDREKRRYEKIEELNKKRQEFLYGKGDREV